MKYLVIILVFACNICYSQFFLDDNFLLINRENSPLTSNKVLKVLNSNNNYWIITERENSNSTFYPGALHLFTGSDWLIYDSTNSPLTMNIVTDAALDKNGKILISSFKGLFIFDGISWLHYNSQNSPLTSDTVFKITVDLQNRYWLGLENEIALYDGNWIFYNNQNSFIGIGDYNFIEVDSSNNIWIGTDFYGLYSYDGMNWVNKIKGQLSGGDFQPVVGFAIDTSNNIWVSLNKEGGGTGKIAHLINDNWIFFDSSNIAIPFRLFSYNGAVVDKKNIKWFGTTDGLLRYDGVNWSIINSSNSPIPSNWFKTGYVDKRNNKIFGISTFLSSEEHSGLLFYNEDSVHITSINQTNPDIPAGFRLYQNYPNPFNPSTKISFTLQTDSKVKLTVYNSLGEIVEELLNKELSKGNHTYSFNAKNLSSGIYFYTINAGAFSKTMKMLLLK